MKWFEKKKPASKPPQVQLRDWERHPFGVLDQYVPLRNGEITLYRSIREAVPIIDAAIWKLVRLCGGYRFAALTRGLSRDLVAFWPQWTPAGASRASSPFWTNTWTA